MDDRDIIQKLIERVAVLETAALEKWNAHNEDAKDRSYVYGIKFDEIKKLLDKLFTEINKMHLECIARPPHCLREMENRIKRFMAWMLGVPALCVSIIAIIEWVKK